MTDYVFVGSEAEGYYSNSYVCEGVFLTKEYYEEHKSELESSFEGRTFCELDGKHSEVDGSLVVKKFDSISELFQFASDIDVSYEVDHLSDYDGSHYNHITQVYENIEELFEQYETYKFVLTPKEYEKVAEFIDKLTKGDDYMNDLLDRINSEIVDSDGDGETLYYAIVETSDETRSLLKELGVKDVNKYVKEFGEEIFETDTEFDISPAVWDSGLSTYFDGDNFLPKGDD